MVRTARTLTVKKKSRRPLLASALALLFAGLWIGTLAATNPSVTNWLHSVLPSVVPASDDSSELAPVFEKDGKTYVAFNHPLVHLTIITDSSCTEKICDYKQILNSIYKEFTPGIVVQTIDATTDEGKNFLTKYQIGGAPAFIFDANITKIPVYDEISQYFSGLNDNLYLLMTPFGKYYSTPDAGTAQSKGASAADAKNTIIAYESFSCAVCKDMVSVIDDALKNHPDTRFVFKYYDRGNSDSLLAQSAECAGEQNKFWEMTDALFAADSVPATVEDIMPIAQTLNLDTSALTSCLSSDKYKDRVAADTFEAKRFGVLGTPAFFINGALYAGALTAEQLDALLAPPTTASNQ